MFNYLSVLAKTHLSENIGGQTLTPAGNPYVVESDLTIPANTQVVIKSGTVILFQSFTGINVYGSLLVEGTKDNPIVFTSINDANYNESAEQLPNSFDWNGIYVNEKAGDIKFRNFKLMYSVFGIKSQKDDITIQNGFFKQNGQFHFTIRDNIHYVQDNISYSYNTNLSQEQADTDKTTDTKSSKNSRTTKKDQAKGNKKEEKSKSGRGKKVAAITLMSVGIASGVSTIITGIVTGQNKKTAEEQNSNEDDYNHYLDKFHNTRTVTIITGVTCGISLPISLFLFIKRDKSKTEKKITLDFKTGNNLLGVGFTRYF